MATADPPGILGYRLNLSAGAYSTRIMPESGAWEVHSVVGSGKFTLYRCDDPNRDGVVEINVPVAQRLSAGEMMGLKCEVGQFQGLVIKNDEPTDSISVEIIGIVLR